MPAVKDSRAPSPPAKSLRALVLKHYNFFEDTKPFLALGVMTTTSAVPMVFDPSVFEREEFRRPPWTMNRLHGLRLLFFSKTP